MENLVEVFLYHVPCISTIQLYIKNILLEKDADCPYSILIYV